MQTEFGIVKKHILSKSCWPIGSYFWSIVYFKTKHAHNLISCIVLLSSSSPQGKEIIIQYVKIPFNHTGTYVNFSHF